MEFLNTIQLIFLIYLIHKQIGCVGSDAPKFCETTHFDGIYHYGYDLVILTKSGNVSWFWTLSKTMGQFIEPPVSKSVEDPTAVQTTFFITDLPDYPECKRGTSDFCDQMTSAITSLFVRFFPDSNGVEAMEVLDVDNASITDWQKAYPWNLTETTLKKVWPSQWDRREDLFRPHSSVFWPKTKEIYYILYSGHRAASALMWRNLSSIDWYNNHMDFVPLNEIISDVNFVGMFHNPSGVQLFLIGDRRQEGDSVTRLFQLVIDGQSREIEARNESIHHFFRCQLPTTEPVTDLNTQTEQQISTTDNVQKVKGTDDNNESQVFIVVIIVIVFIAIILLLFIAFIFVKFRMGSKTGAASNAQSIDTPTEMQSIVTINSNTGHEMR